MQLIRRTLRQCYRQRESIFSRALRAPYNTATSAIFPGALRARCKIFAFGVFIIIHFPKKNELRFLLMRGGLLLIGLYTMSEYSVEKLPLDKIPLTRLVDLKSRLSSLSEKVKADPPWKKIRWDQVPKDIPPIPLDEIPWE